MSSTSFPLELGFRGVICASFGSTDDTAGRDIGPRPRYDVHFASANSETLAELRSALDRSRVGVRLVLAGSSADVHAAAAAAADCGMLDAEMTLVCDENGPWVVCCGHCKVGTATTVPKGFEVVCQGCGIVLATTDHFSRRFGGYLGYAAHAEEAS
ncbi:hypothetical protein FZI85_30155 [Mycobacterium sp. CBMA293]|uniref:dimethylamine monooxygenase subunit DmmA family protein n=1 Tax=unclassified Mycolicibacterium TaxID=2636767 RepID=UPI0012DD2065|nr:MULTISPECIES: dimethylamine monooxygenase subunit DmmA family protein [unclassified Mycolicibacterium]MUL50115.1 hypothetical protein [Mycolicibacterium sp. CBMA 360]MUL62775.1 hypothetical protein [Mycolicibacterium sp. CBMA 335]MUL69593.1 hypothetical protein [Mycolicibacterium sp. CBMA 311]MUL93546.1 hypothetical protein [Mycolicibacterium sp. CBMA 230]MUM07956.1 hypothetical protein [Mycolicibacterium sp. CBMA 213]